MQVCNVGAYNIVYIIIILLSIKDNSRQSVLCLDYNSLDSHIAAAFENGQIGIYGRMSKNKMETFNVDK